MIRVLIGFIFLIISSSFLTSFVAIRFDVSGLSVYWLGAISSFYKIGMTLGSFKSSKMIKNLGFVKSYMGFASLMGACVLGLGFDFIPVFWIVMRFFIGYSLGALYSIIESFVMLNDAKKGNSFAIYGMVLYTGFGIAPYLFKLIENDITTTFPLMLIGLLCFISMIVTSFSGIDKMKIKLKGTKLMFKDILSKAPLGLIYCFGSGFMNVTVYTFFPKILFYHPSIHFTHLIAVSVFGGALFQYPLGLLAQYCKRRTILFVLNIIIACIIPMCILFFKTFWLVLLLAILGGCLFAIYPMIVTYTCNRFEKEDYFNILQTLLLTYGMGSIIAPFILTLVFFNLFTNNVAVFGVIFMMNALLMAFMIGKRIVE